jgi:hypothetical protein
VFFLLFGSSGSGKTFVLDHLPAIGGLAVHRFDELGVPPHPDRAWRHAATEEWIRRALSCQEAGTDMLLEGQVPYGELLAAPSAPRLESVSACLLDCSDAVRLARLEARGTDWLDRAGGSLDDYVAWAAWLRGHARDPQHRPEVITARAGHLAFGRWSALPAGDPRWRVSVIDTDRPIEQVVGDVVDWICAERRAHRFAPDPTT